MGGGRQPLEADWEGGELASSTPLMAAASIIFFLSQMTLYISAHTLSADSIAPFLVAYSSRHQRHERNWRKSG